MPATYHSRPPCRPPSSDEDFVWAHVNTPSRPHALTPSTPHALTPSRPHAHTPSPCAPTCPRARPLAHVWPADGQMPTQVALGADEVPAAKPAADGLLLCCDRLGVEPSASVYVGDAPSDGQAAKAAGMQSIGVLWGANAEAALSGHFDALAADVPTLITTLRKMLDD